MWCKGDIVGTLGHLIDNGYSYEQNENDWLSFEECFKILKWISFAWVTNMRCCYGVCNMQERWTKNQ